MKFKKYKLTPQVKENIQERKKLAWDSLFYSNQRMDLLIITISGAGIYACSEVSKYFLEKELHISNFIKISATLLVLSIIVNFISQWLSAETHQNDYCSSLAQLDDEVDEGLPIHEQLNYFDKRAKQIDEYEKKSNFFNKWTIKFNNLSILLMFAGLLTFISYICFTF